MSPFISPSLGARVMSHLSSSHFPLKIGTCCGCGCRIWLDLPSRPSQTQPSRSGKKWGKKVSSAFSELRNRDDRFNPLLNVPPHINHTTRSPHLSCFPFPLVHVEYAFLKVQWYLFKQAPSVPHLYFVSTPHAFLQLHLERRCMNYLPRTSECLGFPLWYTDPTDVPTLSPVNLCSYLLPKTRP